MPDSNRITVRIAGDGLSAFVTVDVGEPDDADSVTRALGRAGVVFGVDTEAVDRVATVVRDPEGRLVDLLIATGVAAVVGSDGYFSPAFDPGIQPGHVDADGKMDFRDRALLKPVAAHSPLGVLHPAVPSTAGKRVDGGAIAVANVREASLALGPGVLRAPDGGLSAAVDGVILYLARKHLDVVRHHRHRGDVDLRSGHLDMAGSLSVSGDVQRMFHVRASGDVEVAGSIHGGCAYAGGALSVKGIVQGSDADLRAGGDVHARSAERARIRSGALLKLESAVHCALEAKVIEVGVLRGGAAHAERFAIAREAGFVHGGETAIHAGVPLERVQDDDVRGALASARAERSHERARGSRGPGDRGGKAGRERSSLQRDDLQRLVAQRQEHEALLHAAHVVVQSIAHPGVTIQIGDARLTLDDPIESARFSYHAPSRSIRIERFVS